MKRRHARQISEPLILLVLLALSFLFAKPLGIWMLREFPMWNRFAVKSGVLAFVCFFLVALFVWCNRKLGNP